MPSVIIFLGENQEPNNLTEIHVFEDDRKALAFSNRLCNPTDPDVFRPHLLKVISADCWHVDKSPTGGRSYKAFEHEVPEFGG